ncbi:MAG: hypothetical protein JW787_14595 [Sedimentisphaerales bacterium]|nr:hypothetical protein [Sedimentisphaerales bacterium]
MKYYLSIIVLMCLFSGQASAEFNTSGGSLSMVLDNADISVGNSDLFDSAAADIMQAGSGMTDILDNDNFVTVNNSAFETDDIPAGLIYVADDIELYSSRLRFSSPPLEPPPPLPFTVVPLPATILLGFIGLGVGGLKLRKSMK